MQKKKKNRSLKKSATANHHKISFGGSWHIRWTTPDQYPFIVWVDGSVTNITYKHLTSERTS